MQITIVDGDITDQRVDAVVNAANSSLLGGGGVDGAIHAAAGPELLAQCRAVREHEWPDGLPAGEAVATPAGDLPATHVIHTVGPNRHAGQTDPAVLESCFRRSLEVAVQIDAAQLAFPAVGAGVYGWSPADVAAAARRVLDEIAADGSGQFDVIEEVRFVLFGSAAAEAFRAEFPPGARADARTDDSADPRD